MSILLLAMYITVICYIVVSAALVSGQGLYTYKLCDAGTWVCLMFYTMAKACVYAFLVERVHIVRAPFVRRSKDKIYLACVVPAVILYTAICINSYFWRVTSMHSSDGRCHFGIRSIASIPILSVNIFTNVGLTGVFFYLLRPMIKLHGSAGIAAALTRKSKTESTDEPIMAETTAQRNIKMLLWKSIIGAILIELPVTANMVQFIVTRGQELGMLCLTFCMGDVFWDALVIHWLTFGSSSVAEKDLLRWSKTNSRQALRQHVSLPSRSSSPREDWQNDYVRAPETAYMHDMEITVRMDLSGVDPSLPR